MPPPQPYRPVDLIMQGTQSLGQGISGAWSSARAETQANAPVDPMLEEYIRRMMSGEDPQALGQEARSRPDFQKLMEGLKGGQGPAPADVVPDVGMRGNVPTLSPPGQVSPSGGPLGPAGSQHQQSLGALDMLPPAQVGSMQRGAFQGGGDGGVGFMQELKQGGSTPMPGAPQVPPQAAIAPARQPLAPTTQPAPPQSQLAPGKAAPPRMTNRDFDRLSPMLPTMIASQGREQVAQTQAQARLQDSSLRAEKDVLVQVMKQNGIHDKVIAQKLVEIEGMDVKQQQFVMKMMVDLMRSRISADATLGSAGIRTSGQESSAEKELRTIEKGIAELTKVPDWSGQPDLAAKMNLYVARMGELQRMVGREGPSTPPAIGPEKPRAAPPKAAPASPQGQKTGSKRIRVVIQGRSATVDEADFNPKTMQRQP